MRLVEGRESSVSLLRSASTSVGTETTTPSCGDLPAAIAGSWAGLAGDAISLCPTAQSPFEGGKAGEVGVLLYVAVEALAGNAQGAGHFGFTARHQGILSGCAELAFQKLTGKVTGKVAGFAELRRL